MAEGAADSLCGGRVEVGGLWPLFGRSLTNASICSVCPSVCSRFLLSPVRVCTWTQGIDHWYKFYNEHDKYRAVGWLDLPDIADDAPMPNDEC